MTPNHYGFFQAMVSVFDDGVQFVWTLASKSGLFGFILAVAGVAAFVAIVAYMDRRA